MIIKMNGKTYKVTSAEKAFRENTEEDLDNHFNGNGIDARWGRHIKEINEILKQPTIYKAGRPHKNPAKENINGEAPEIG